MGDTLKDILFLIAAIFGFCKGNILEIIKKSGKIIS